MAALAILTLCFIAPVPAVAQQDEAPLPKPTRYTRSLGPFPIEGHNFTVELKVICYKESKHAGECTEDDEETVSSVKIVDEKGKHCFSKSYPESPVHHLGRHQVDATLLEGREHQALELTYEKLPSPPRTGESIQLFALLNGDLKPLNREPLEFSGGLADLPAGKLGNSKRLLENDTLQIYSLTTYFYIVTPVRVDWKHFRLDTQDSGEFEVIDQPPYQTRQTVESDRLVDLYPSPDTKATSVEVRFTPQSSVQLLKARFKGAPPDAHDKASDTWLKVRIDGREGWIIGVDDYTALGLSFIQPE